jgi:hypothetical protein
MHVDLVFKMPASSCQLLAACCLLLAKTIWNELLWFPTLSPNAGERMGHGDDVQQRAIKS